jgi:hypothetical protein
MDRAISSIPLSFIYGEMFLCLHIAHEQLDGVDAFNNL